MEQSFLDLHVHGNLLGIVLKSSAWFSPPKMGPQSLYCCQLLLLCFVWQEKEGLEFEKWGPSPEDKTPGSSVQPITQSLCPPFLSV